MSDQDDQPNGPWRDGKVWIMARLCDTCIFRPDNPMHLKAGCVDEMVDDCLSTDSFIVCHDTLDGPRSVCRGFWARHRHDVLPLRMAIFLELQAFDNSLEEHL